MKKLLSTALVGLALAATPVLAGDASMKNAEGAKLKIKCQNSGCKVRQKVKGGKWTVIERMAGGTKNFGILEAKYKELGFK